MIRIANRTEQALVPYPVVTTPPPPHRERDLDQRVPHGCYALIDPLGFNVVYSNELFSITDRSVNGFSMQFDTSTSPTGLLYRAMHFRVAPGDEGTDPDLQPWVVEETYRQLRPFPPGELYLDAEWKLKKTERPILSGEFMLDVFPAQADPLEVVYLRVCGGVAGKQVQIVVATIDGVPANQSLAVDVLDDHGMYLLQGAVPGATSFSGQTLGLVAFSVNSKGQTVESDPVSLTFT